VAQEISVCVERHSSLYEAGSKVMTQVMPAKARDVCTRQQLRPGGFETGDDGKDTSAATGLLAPTIQQPDCFIIERHMAGLTCLGVAAFHREPSTTKVDRRPLELRKFTPTQARVHGYENSGR
jgi:hypothetical protein